MFALLVLSYFTVAFSFNVFIQTSAPIRRVPQRFLSISLDTLTARSNWCGLNFTFIEPLAIALGPEYLRFGGTEADALIFNQKQSIDTATKAHERCETIQSSPLSNFTFTGHQLDQIYSFTKKVGWRLIFDLNLVLRNGSEWNSSNAEQLLQYARSRGYDMDFELGNEPNDFRHKFNISLTGAQIAEDFRHLRHLLNSLQAFKSSRIIGPSTSHRSLKLLRQFVRNGGGKSVNAITFHFYYMNGRTATLKDFLNATILDSIQPVINSVKNSVHQFVGPRMPIWLGETASAYGGGAPNLSNTFASGFMWLDKLGMSALLGLDVVVRQSLFHGHYALLNESMIPNHDFWLSVLYKKLVGQNVLQITFQKHHSNVRLYAACSAKNKGIVIYGVNLANETFTINFPQFEGNRANVYVLKEADSGNLSSRYSKLNGKLLEWKAGEPLPEMRGDETKLPITLPGYCQFFIHISWKIKACN